MSLPEDMIMDQLHFVLDTSDAGDTMHHLSVVTSDGKREPLGVASLGQLETTMYGIAPDGRSLGEHPHAVEVDRVYGVFRDGRRWTGRRYLAGSRAGGAGGAS